MNKIMPKPSPQTREAVKEGAAEVREKLKSDISRWTRARRFVSLKPTLDCMECDGTGKHACSACGGEGLQKVVWNEEEQACPTCVGKGTVTCVECAGIGEVENKHRKKLVWVLAIGGLAWGYILFRLWGGDVAPELRARYLSGGGGGYSTGRPGSNPGTGTQSTVAPGGPNGGNALTAPNNSAVEGRNTGGSHGVPGAGMGGGPMNAPNNGALGGGR